MSEKKQNIVEMEIMSLNVPVDLRHDFNVTAKQRDLNYQQALAQALRLWIDTPPASDHAITRIRGDRQPGTIRAEISQALARAQELRSTIDALLVSIRSVAKHPSLQKSRALDLSSDADRAKTIAGKLVSRRKSGNPRDSRGYSD